MIEKHSALPNGVAHRLRRSRRRALQQLAGLLSISSVPLLAGATPASMADALREQFRTTTIGEGKVTLSIPALAENGNSVALTVTVDSPMTSTDYVESIQVFAQHNPLPTVIELQLSRLSGRAAASTRIRLSDSQTIIAVARMHDGSLWSGAAKTIVTLAACTDYLF